MSAHPIEPSPTARRLSGLRTQNRRRSSNAASRERVSRCRREERLASICSQVQPSIPNIRNTACLAHLSTGCPKTIAADEEALLEALGYTVRARSGPLPPRGRFRHLRGSRCAVPVGPRLSLAIATRHNLTVFEPDLTGQKRCIVGKQTFPTSVKGQPQPEGSAKLRAVSCSLTGCQAGYFRLSCTWGP